jgi:hypothetical protein
MREKVNMGLALFQIDKAITDKRLGKPTHEEISGDLSPEVWAHREMKNVKLMECYQIEKINWERTNHMCLMVIKEMIS